MHQKFKRNRERIGETLEDFLSELKDKTRCDFSSFVFHVKQVQNCYFYKIWDKIELKRNFVKSVSFCICPVHQRSPDYRQTWNVRTYTRLDYSLKPETYKVPYISVDQKFHSFALLAVRVFDEWCFRYFVLTFTLSQSENFNRIIKNENFGKKF